MNQPKPSRPAVPARINGLAAVAANLSWSWNRNARALFRMLDPALWRRTQHNPI
jgi:glycogen phosphorylase